MNQSCMRSEDRSPTTARGTAQGWARRLAAVLMAGAVAAVPAAWSQAQNNIRAITTTSEGGNDVVRVELDKPLTELPKGFSIQSPARIALDFAGVGNATGRTAVELNQGNIKSANVVEAGDRTRVVLNLGQASQYQAQISGNSLLVVLQGSASVGAPRASAQAAFAEASNQDVLPLRGVDFRRGAQGAGRVIVDLPNAQVGVDIRQQGKALVVEFLKASLPDSLRRRLDVVDFGTPIQTVTTTQNGDRVRLLVEPTGSWEHSAYQSDSQFVLEVREVKQDPNKLTQGLSYSGEKLSLNFQNIDIRSLLGVFAEFTSLNIVASDSVVGSLTLRLKDVPWDQAFDIVLESKGLAYAKNGNVISVAPREELSAKDKGKIESIELNEKVQPLRTQAFRLNYAKAKTIMDQLTGAGGGAATVGGTLAGDGDGGSKPSLLLSSRGSVIQDERTNQLFVTDIPSKLEQITALVAKVDIPRRQVMIEARIVEANDNFSKSLGVRLGGADLRGIRGGDAGYGIGGGNRVALGGSYSAIQSTTGQGGALSENSTTFLNLPARSTAGDAARLAFSIFSPSANRFLNLEISALESDGKGKVISSPRLITADQNKASISQGLSIPYRTIQNGSTNTIFKDAVLKLDVTPQITPEGSVEMKLQINKDSFGINTDAGPAINKKEIITDVLVESGGTVVIGGIFEEETQNDVAKVPVLGDIPVVGNLFKSRSTNVARRELLVFITPRIMRDGSPAR